MAASNGTVDPKSAHSLLAPGGASPLSVETGTSTAGVRTPPRALPSASRAITGGDVVDELAAAAPSEGARPRSIHRVERRQRRLRHEVLGAFVDE